VICLAGSPDQGRGALGLVLRLNRGGDNRAVPAAVADKDRGKISADLSVSEAEIL